jgi:hypothetical protein
MATRLTPTDLKNNIDTNVVSSILTYRHLFGVINIEITVDFYNAPSSQLLANLSSEAVRFVLR